MEGFDYTNLSGRPVSPFVRYAGWVLPGVRRVQAQAGPYAAAWRRDNLAALERPADDGPLWVALGDSMTLGIGATAHDRGWVGQLADRIADRLGVRPRVVDLGFHGARVDDVVERQLPVLESLPTPDLVTVLIGNNDLVSRTWRVGLDERTAELLARLPRRSVVANQPGAGPAVRSFNAVVEQGVAAHDLVLADCRVPAMRSWRGKLAADFFHPNDRGYAAIADTIGVAVLPLVAPD